MKEFRLTPFGLEPVETKPEVKFEVYSLRVYGEPKIKKPKELRGIRPKGSIPFLDRAKCQYFINGADVWVKHRDYFSEYMTGEEARKSQRFIYQDEWGAVVLRNEAWIAIKNLALNLDNNHEFINSLNSIIRQQERYHNFKENSLLVSEMARFWEGLLIEVRKEDQ